MITIVHETWEDLDVTLPEDHVRRVVDPLLLVVGQRLAAANLMSVLLEWPNPELAGETISITFPMPGKEDSDDAYASCDVEGIPTGRLRDRRGLGSRSRFRLVDAVCRGFGAEDAAEALARTYKTRDPEGVENLGRMWDVFPRVRRRLVELYGADLSLVVRAVARTRALFLQDGIEDARRKRRYTNARTDVVLLLSKHTESGVLSREDLLDIVDSVTVKSVMES